MATKPIPTPTPWINTALGIALSAAPTIIGLLVAGIELDHRAAAAVMAAAAVTIGFGAYKRLYGSAGPAMGLTAVGLGFSAFVGTLVGQAWETLIAIVFVWGFVTGLLPVLKSDLSWVGQQCTIVLLVASAFPGSVERATDRALLVFGGSALQFLCITVLVGLFAPHAIRLPSGWTAQARTMGLTLVTEVRTRTAAVGLATRLAVVLGVAVEIWHWMEWDNGYWIGMTVLLLVRSEFRDTLFRVAERIAGTILGALLATIVMLAVPVSSSPWIAASLTGAFALLTLTLQQGNRIGSRTLTYPGSYAVFAGSLTAYVVFLLDYGGLSPRGVVGERVLLTMIGGLLALVVHIPLDVFRVAGPTPVTPVVRN
jgi:hypothetical protein